MKRHALCTIGELNRECRRVRPLFLILNCFAGTNHVRRDNEHPPACRQPRCCSCPTRTPSEPVQLNAVFVKQHVFMTIIGKPFQLMAEMAV